MERSAAGQSGLEFGVRPFSLQGNDAWPGREYFHVHDYPKAPQKARIGKVGRQERDKTSSFTPFAQGFIRRCTEAGLDPRQTVKQAAAAVPLGQVSASHEAAFHAGFVPGRNPKATEPRRYREGLDRLRGRWPSRRQKPQNYFKLGVTTARLGGQQRPTRQLSTPDSFQE